MPGERRPAADPPLRVDRASPLPLHAQVQQALKDRIVRRTWKPGDLVPGDVELTAELGVSRTTVRQALADLAREGWIQRERGRGTFVALPKLTERAVERLTGFYEDMLALGLPPVSQVLRQQVKQADEPVAARLNLRPGTRIVEIERLRFVEDEPVVLTTTYLPHSLVPGLESVDLTRRSLYEVLLSEYGLPLDRGRRTIEAVPADSRQARLLRIRKGAPLAFIQSVSYLADGRPIEFHIAYHRGDRSRFEVELMRDKKSVHLPPGGGTIGRTAGR